MPIDSKELMRAIAIIANERNVRVVINQSGKGALICAACSFVGGLLAGPLGLALGGAAGGVAAFKATSGTFLPLHEVLLNMTDTQREQLMRRLKAALADLHPTDMIMVVPFILNNVAIKEALFKVVMTFVRNEMRLQIVG